jgi:IS6 family transposase
VIDEVKKNHAIGQRCRGRVVPYLNNIVEQDHRSIKRRINANLGFRSFASAERTIQGYEAMHMIRKRTGSMVGKGRYRPTSPLYQIHLRTHCLIGPF